CHRIEAGAAGIRPVGPERRDAGEDDLGLHRAQGLVVETHLRHDVDRQVRDHDIGGLHQPANDLPGFGLGAVERYAALVAVEREKGAAFALVGDRTRVAVFAAAPPVHAYDVRTHVGEQRRAVRACDEAAEIDNANSAERTGVSHGVARSERRGSLPAGRCAVKTSGLSIDADALRRSRYTAGWVERREPRVTHAVQTDGSASLGDPASPTHD